MAGAAAEWKEGEQPLIPTSMVPPKTHSIRTVHIALVIVQLGYAGLQMFSRVALDAGLNQFLLSMYRNMIAFAILGPIAYYYERYVHRSAGPETTIITCAVASKPAISVTTAISVTAAISVTVRLLLSAVDTDHP